MWLKIHRDDYINLYVMGWRNFLNLALVQLNNFSYFSILTVPNSSKVINQDLLPSNKGFHSLKYIIS